MQTKLLSFLKEYKGKKLNTQKRTHLDSLQ